MYAEVNVTKKSNQERYMNRIQIPLQNRSINRYRKDPQMSEKELECKIVLLRRRKFMFTAEEQEHHLKTGWTHQPNKCDSCRQKNRKNQPCFWLSERRNVALEVRVNIRMIRITLSCLQFRSKHQQCRHLE